MRRLRKDTIFRIYLFSFLALCVLALCFCLSMQSRKHIKRIEALSERLTECESRLASRAETGGSSEVASVERSETPIDRAIRKQNEELFWVEGHGSNGVYHYLDLCFKDGYRARYYFRPYPSRSELVSLHRRISHDAIAHYYDVSLDES